jgi:lytic murein transglycosylase
MAKSLFLKTIPVSVTMLLLSLFGGAAARADCNNPSSFPAWLDDFKDEAAGSGISKRALSALRGITYDASVIKRDRSQSVFSQDFLTFSGRMASGYRLKQGAALIKKYKPLFDQIEERYGVPAPVIVAFWGLETDFGANMGDFSTLRALATLAFDCRRPEKFRPQLQAALQLIDHGDLPPQEMVGAWAGEIGQVQFLPQDYLESGVDFDGDGRRDLRHSVPDVLASTASLLVNHGWQANQPWLQEVSVPDDLPWEEADIAITHSRAEWVKWGVKARVGKLKADRVQASLLLPMGRNGPAFLAYPNFTQTYLKWNESLVYSTTAGYFATRLAGAPPVDKGNGAVEVLSREEMIQLQKLLVQRGYDVGKLDGVAGAKTRAAVKEMQIKFGLPPDSWPTHDLLARLNGG